MQTLTREPIEILDDNGFYHRSDLPFLTTETGIEYYVGYNDFKEAAVVAIIQDEENYFITKQELREMSFTAKIMGIEKLHLLTNYGIELHSKHEKAKDVGFDQIHKITS